MGGGALNGLPDRRAQIKRHAKVYGKLLSDMIRNSLPRVIAIGSN